MKKLLVLTITAVVLAAAAFSAPAQGASAFCMDWDCVTPSPWVPTPPWLGSGDQSCDDHGGVVSDSVEWVWRGAVLVKLVHVTCKDGHTFTLEEGPISYTEPEPPPPPPDVYVCPGPDDPNYDPNYEPCW